MEKAEAEHRRRERAAEHAAAANSANPPPPKMGKGTDDKTRARNAEKLAAWRKSKRKAEVAANGILLEKQRQEAATQVLRTREEKSRRAKVRAQREARLAEQVRSCHSRAAAAAAAAASSSSSILLRLLTCSSLRLLCSMNGVALG